MTDDLVKTILEALNVGELTVDRCLNVLIKALQLLPEDERASKLQHIIFVMSELKDDFDSIKVGLPA